MDVITLRGEIETTRILWGAALQGSARDILAQAETQEDPGDRSATEEAVDWLASFLAAGPVSAKDVQREAKEAGISEKSLRRGREKLKVRPFKAGFSGGWQWALPIEEGEKAP